MDNKDPVAIVCTIDNAYAKHCTVTLASLFINNPTTIFNVYILYNSLKQEHIDKLIHSLKKYDHDISLIELNDSALHHAPITHHISLATYYRILIPQLLPQTLNKVLFLDADIIIRKSIKDLWDTDISNYPLAATIAAGMDEYPPSILLPAEGLYFNAGVMLINLSAWRSINLLNKCIDLLKNELHRIKWWDQDLLNIIFEKCWLPLDLKWNAQPYLFDGIKNATECIKSKYESFNYIEATTDPAVVHFAGGDKPWMRNCKMPFAEEYHTYLNKTLWKPSFYERFISNLKYFLRHIKSKYAFIIY